MGRPNLLIDRVAYQAEVNRLEKERQFTKRSDVFLALAETDWARNVRDSNGGLIGAKAPTLYAYAKKLNIAFATEPGKRGRVGGNPNLGAMRESRGKRERKPFPQAVYDSVPVEHHKTVKRAELGSKKALAKLMCLQCTNSQRQEIRYCTSIQCGQYRDRPYQHAGDVIQIAGYIDKLKAREASGEWVGIERLA